MNLTEYCKHYGSIAQESEKLFIANFLYPLVGEKIDKGPQYPFLDRTGRSRRIDFAIQGSHGHPSLRGKRGRRTRRKVLFRTTNLTRICSASNRRTVIIKSLVLVPPLVRSYTREEEEASRHRLNALKAAWPDKAGQLTSTNLSIFRELFGTDFLTERYKLRNATFVEEI